MERLTVGNLYPTTAKTLAPAARSRSNVQQVAANAASFDGMLQKSLVKLSHHAEVRLQQRGIELKPEQLAKIESAIDKAASKGSKESLIVYDNMAFIVNVKNRTIVTAMDSESMKENVFTQIDSAVILS